MSSDSSSTLTIEEIEDRCRAAAGGDSDALIQLIEHYHHRFLGFTIRKIGRDWKGKIEPDDVLQDAYISVFESISGYELTGNESFYHWVTQIISRRFVDRVRHNRRGKRDIAQEIAREDLSASGCHMLLQKCAPTLASPSVDARRAEATIALLECIQKLPEHYRLVIERRFLMEQPVATIAAECGHTESAVRGIITRAMPLLTECLGRASAYLSSRG